MNGDCEEYNGTENVARLFAGKKLMFGVAVYMATATAFTTSTGPLTSSIGQVGIMRSWNIRPEGEAVLARINNVLHGRQ